MNTSLLYHAFGIQHQKVLRTEYFPECLQVKVKTNDNKLQCPICKGWNVIKSGIQPRSFRTIPIGKKPVIINAQLQRLECKTCEKVRQEHISYANPRNTYTHSFRRYVLELSKLSTIKAIADHLGVGWDLVKEIQKKYLKDHFSKPSLKDVKTIAIDEFAVKKGHNYMTVVLDLETGIILHVGKGKGADALKGFWKRVTQEKINIEAVAIDLSPAYISAVTENLPEAKIIFDHFHIIKLFNDQLSELRRELYIWEKDLNNKRILKGTRWLLLKNSENLDPKHKEEERLSEALKINEPLAIAYYLKEDLGQIWEQSNKKTAEKFMYSWASKALSSKIPRLAKFANTLLSHRSGILNWYDYPISTGPLEGTNNKIKVLKRMAYGYRDLEFFRLKLYALHLTTYALSG